MSIESSITAHYGGTELLAAIEAGLEAMGRTRETVTVEDLGPVDEFHIGGRAATVELCERLGLTADASLLDLGCGIGGTARLVASTFGCSVTGIDLTPAYVEVARTLTEWTGLSDRVDFEVGSALDLPFDDGSFDVVTLLHVGMNIEDKPALFAQARRALRPGGRLGVYDVMRTSEAGFEFPVPWSSDPSTSWVADLGTYERALTDAGFHIDDVRDRGELGLEFFAAMKARTAELGGPPPLGLHVIIGADTPTKVANMVGAIGAGAIAPIEVLCTAA